MDLPTVILCFLILYFMQWVYIMYSCEKKLMFVSTNRSTFEDMNLCLTSHSSPVGLELIVEKFSFSFIYFIEKISFATSKIGEQTSNIIMKIYEESSKIIVITTVIIFMYPGRKIRYMYGRIFNRNTAQIRPFTARLHSLTEHCKLSLGYAGVNRRSDAANTIREIFHATRDDLSAIFRELRSSFKEAFNLLYNTLTIVKISEVIIIGMLLSGLHEILDFLSKAISKTAKI